MPLRMDLSAAARSGLKMKKKKKEEEGGGCVMQHNAPLDATVAVPELELSPGNTHNGHAGTKADAKRTTAGQ